MLYIIIVFISCFAIIPFSFQNSDLSKLQKIIKQKVNVERINKNEHIVKFKDESCKIYFFDPTNDNEIMDEDKESKKIFMKFYTCLNCRMAIWINNTVFNYTEISTKSYQTFNLDDNLDKTIFKI